MPSGWELRSMAKTRWAGSNLADYDQAPAQNSAMEVEVLVLYRKNTKIKR